MNGNPYGAVPEALKETRLTLRDIMAAHLENKVAEGRLNLEKTKAETETALITANLKRDELANLRDTAHLNQAGAQFREGQAQQKVQFGQNLTLQQAAEARAAKGQTEQHEIATGQLDLAKSGEERAAREEQRKNEERTIGDWAAAAGVHSGLVEFMGVDPNKKIKRSDAENLYGTINAAFKANPSMALMAHGYSLKNELIVIQEKLRTPGLPPDQAAALKKKYDKGLATFENLDKLIMAEKAPDQTKIIQAARQSYTDNPSLQTEYPTFPKYLDWFENTTTKARGVFQDDIGKLKTAGATGPKDDVTDDTAIMKGLNDLEVMAPTNLSMEIIKGLVKQKLQAGDKAGARRITEQMLKTAVPGKKRAEAVPAPAGFIPPEQQEPMFFRMPERKKTPS